MNGALRRLIIRERRERLSSIGYLPTPPLEERPPLEGPGSIRERLRELRALAPRVTSPPSQQAADECDADARDS